MWALWLCRSSSLRRTISEPPPRLATSQEAPNKLDSKEEQLDLDLDTPGGSTLHNIKVEPPRIIEGGRSGRGLCMGVGEKGSDTTKPGGSRSGLWSEACQGALGTPSRQSTADTGSSVANIRKMTKDYHGKGDRQSAPAVH